MAHPRRRGFSFLYVPREQDASPLKYGSRVKLDHVAFVKAVTYNFYDIHWFGKEHRKANVIV